jgi:hypothetical protein
MINLRGPTMAASPFAKHIVLPKPVAPTAQEVRETVLSDHLEVRARLAAIRGHLDASEAADGEDALESAVEVFRGLEFFLWAHLAFEDQYLAPLLTCDLAWGRLRAETMLEHHFGQRQELAALRKLVDAPGTDASVLVAALREFITEEETDISLEEDYLVPLELSGASLSAS